MILYKTLLCFSYDFQFSKTAHIFQIKRFLTHDQQKDHHGMKRTLKKMTIILMNISSPGVESKQPEQCNMFRPFRSHQTRLLVR